ncbi:Interferon-induced protein 44-like [Mizuhopecten yessoensis]|uniref:Interferon-induced protein 44-like n=1 Tax=Mizuhopecten yessoensis TaxID=6573 RepID=A0A210PP63_MIZYE|nr:Interferon-induced protein 44-like [Mizuhopecten yessoensis]
MTILLYQGDSLPVASEEDLKTVRLNKDHLAQELETVRQEHLTTRTDLEKQRVSLRGDNNVLSSKVKTLQQNVAVLETQLGVSEDELKTLRLNRDHMTQELETEQRNHHTTRTELGEQIVSLRGDNTVLSSKVGKFQQNVSVLEKQLVACGDELKVVKFNEDILTQELERKQQTCADLEEYIVSLKGDNTAMSSTVEKLKRDVAMMERQLDAEYQQSQKIFLEAGEAVGMLDRQWRVEPIFDHQYLQNIKDEVEQYWPLRDTGVSMDALRHVNILFIGPIGAGKSSFLNSVESAFRGHVTITAGAGSRTKSVTSMYRQYPVRASDNRHTMKLRLCDCRGLEDRIGISRDIDSILEGHMPDDYAFNTSFPLTWNMHGYKHNPSLEDRIHCVVYVLDAETYSGELGIPFVTEPVREQIKTIQEAVDQRGIPQLAILSKVDNICEATKQHTAMVYRSPIIRQRCVDAAGCLGLPPMTVMPMKNYFWETSTKDDISILALYNIRQMLRAADSFLRANHLDELRADRHK